MDYASLIDKLQSLPEDKQATVFDFVEFLFSRYQCKLGQEKNLTESSLPGIFDNKPAGCR